jgi:hypothetical protein
METPGWRNGRAVDRLKTYDDRDSSATSNSWYRIIRKKVSSTGRLR